jgi:hypothetical protein
MKLFLKDREVSPKWAVPFVVVVIVFLAAVWGILILEDFVEKRAREAVLSALNDLSPTATVTINGQTRQKEPVLEALRRVEHIDSHHSSPLTPIEVDIRDGSKTITLVVAQDSERPNEYWVYRPGRNYHNDPLGEFIGRAQTEVFRDNSKPRGK